MEIGAYNGRSQLELRDDGRCFACGPLNPIGLKLQFAEKDGEYITRFTPSQEHQGFVGITHGGIISTVLDEVMARYVYVKGYRAVTAEISIKLRKPAPTGEELIVTGRINSKKGRLLECSAEARNSSGDVIAVAEARMLEV